MNGKGKIQEDFKGKVVVSEVLNRLGIDFEILGFGDDFKDNIFEFKKFGEKFSEGTRNRMAKIVSMPSGNTPAGKGLERASERLARMKGKDNFLIVLTDGEPTDISKEALKEKARELGVRSRQKIIGVGLGSGTAPVVEAFPIGLGNLKIEDISGILAKLIILMIKHPHLSEDQIQKNMELLKTGRPPKGLNLVEASGTMRDLKNLLG